MKVKIFFHQQPFIRFQVLFPNSPPLAICIHESKISDHKHLHAFVEYMKVKVKQEDHMDMGENVLDSQEEYNNIFNDTNGPDDKSVELKEEIQTYYRKYKKTRITFEAETTTTELFTKMFRTTEQNIKDTFSILYPEIQNFDWHPFQIGDEHVYMLARRDGLHINTYDDYLTYLDQVITEYKRNERDRNHAMKEKKQNVKVQEIVNLSYNPNKSKKEFKVIQQFNLNPSTDNPSSYNPITFDSFKSKYRYKAEELKNNWVLFNFIVDLYMFEIFNRFAKNLTTNDTNFQPFSVVLSRNDKILETFAKVSTTNINQFFRIFPNVSAKYVEIKNDISSSQFNELWETYLKRVGQNDAFLKVHFVKHFVMVHQSGGGKQKQNNDDMQIDSTLRRSTRSVPQKTLAITKKPSLTKKSSIPRNQEDILSDMLSEVTLTESTRSFNKSSDQKKITDMQTLFMDKRNDLSNKFELTYMKNIEYNNQNSVQVLGPENVLSCKVVDLLEFLFLTQEKEDTVMQGGFYDRPRMQLHMNWII